MLQWFVRLMILGACGLMLWMGFFIYALGQEDSVCVTRFTSPSGKETIVFRESSGFPHSMTYRVYQQSASGQESLIKDFDRELSGVDSHCLFRKASVQWLSNESTVRWSVFLGKRRVDGEFQLTTIWSRWGYLFGGVVVLMVGFFFTRYKRQGDIGVTD